MAFTDQDQISSYALESVLWAAEKGFIKGRTDGSYAPKLAVTREDLAVIIKRVYDDLTAGGVTPTPDPEPEPEQPPVTPPPETKTPKTKAELDAILLGATVFVDTAAVGAGVVIEGGYLLTAAHVGRDLVQLPLISQKSKNRFTATLVTAGPPAPVGKEIDIKLYKLDRIPSDVVPMKLTTAGVKHDDPVYTLHPAYSGSGTYKQGKVCLEQTSSEAWEFDCSIPAQPGNSGGACINQYGELVGVVVERTSVTVQNGSVSELTQGAEITNLAYPAVVTWLQQNKLV